MVFRFLFIVFDNILLMTWIQLILGLWLWTAHDITLNYKSEGDLYLGVLLLSLIMTLIILEIDIII